jgi:hypothetical protein
MDPDISSKSRLGSILFLMIPYFDEFLQAISAYFPVFLLLFFALLIIFLTK